MLYEQGVRDAPFFVVERGLVRFIDHRPDRDVLIAKADARTFLGDIAVFTGEPSIAACVAVEPTEVIAFERWELREMLAGWPEFAEYVLRALEVYELEQLDFAEAYLVAQAEATGVSAIASFDRSIDRVTSISRREP